MHSILTNIKNIGRFLKFSDRGNGHTVFLLQQRIFSVEKIIFVLELFVLIYELCKSPYPSSSRPMYGMRKRTVCAMRTQPAKTSMCRMTWNI